MIKNIDWSIPKCELAYSVGEEFFRKGYATEAIQAGYLKDEYRTGNKQLVDLIYFASFPNES